MSAEDRARIVELLVRYAFCCDDRDFEGAGGCFTADAQAEYSGVRLPRGVAHIVAHLRPLANLPATQHIVGSVGVRLAGHRATSRSYVVAHLVRATGDGHEVVHRGLRYDDELVRTDDGWRIADRLHRVLWSTTEPTVWPVPGFTATR
jgi:3-phenylpropionate/cinnamic acid dioxygenase small subunit